MDNHTANNHLRDIKDANFSVCKSKITPAKIEIDQKKKKTTKVTTPYIFFPKNIKFEKKNVFHFHFYFIIKEALVHVYTQIS